MQEGTHGRLLVVGSFLLPLLIWSAISYLPFLWHPNVVVTEPGGVSYFREGMQIERSRFEEESKKAEQAGKPLPEGYRANPVYLPAPDQVFTAMYTAFTTEPKRRSEQWLHESLWHSITIIASGFFSRRFLGFH